MERTFSEAGEHIRIMENRIRQQETAIRQLESAGQDTSAAVRRLTLLHTALDDMRLHLAQLALAEEPAAAPAWSLPLAMLGTLRN